jgi:hypothetical protein
MTFKAQSTADLQQCEETTWLGIHACSKSKYIHCINDCCIRYVMVQRCRQNFVTLKRMTIFGSAKYQSKLKLSNLLDLLADSSLNKILLK